MFSIPKVSTLNIILACPGALCERFGLDSARSETHSDIFFKVCRVVHVLPARTCSSWFRKNENETKWNQNETTRLQFFDWAHASTNVREKVRKLSKANNM